MRTILAMSAVAALLCLANVDAEEKSKTKAACPVSGGPANMDHAVDYKKGEVYFCCPKCPNAFKADTEKFATKANHQLVVTKQYKQAKCPLSGQPCDSEKTTKVAGVKVAFCCGNCLAKANGAEGEEQINLVFSDSAFEKGFTAKKKKE